MGKEAYKEVSRIVSCLCIGFFGVLATMFGIVAEVKRVKVDEVVVMGDDDCFYPASNPSWLMAVLAASSLLLSQLIATTSSCVGFARRHNNNTTTTSNLVTTLLCFLLSWISFANALFLLLEGATLDEHQRNYGQGMVHSCYIIKSGVLGAGAALSMLTCVLSIICFLSVTSINAHDHTTSNALGQGSIDVSSVNCRVSPMFCFNPNYNTSAYSGPPPIAYVAGLELPKRYGVSY